MGFSKPRDCLGERMLSPEEKKARLIEGLTKYFDASSVYIREKINDPSYVGKEEISKALNALNNRQVIKI